MAPPTDTENPAAIEARSKLAAAIEVVHQADANAETARQKLYAAIAEVSPALKQAEIVRATGWSREHVRNIAAGRIPGKR